MAPTESAESAEVSFSGQTGSSQSEKRISSGVTLLQESEVP